MAIEYKNTILQRLSPDSISRLKLERVDLERKRTIETPGREIKHLFFIEDGIGSMTASFADGSEVEVGMFGYESVMGASALIGTRRSLNKVYIQLAGWGYSTTVDLARAEFRQFGRFHDLVLRYVQANLVQAVQTAGCNARHSVEQRLARWVLLSSDRSEQPVMDLTQEFLAHMLGCERPAISAVAAKLQAKHLIEYSRGKVRVIDRAGLERVACECYRVVRHHLNSYAVLDEGMG